MKQFIAKVAVRFLLSLIGLGSGAMAGCAGLPDVNALQALRVSLTDLRLEELDRLTPRFLVRLKVDNPNDQAVDFDGADATSLVDGQPVAAGTSRSRLSVMGRGSSNLSLDVTARTLPMVQQFLKLHTQPSLDYEIAGHLVILNWLGDLGKVPFSLRGTVDRDTLYRGL